MLCVKLVELGFLRGCQIYVWRKLTFIQQETMTFIVYNSYACPISTLTIKVLEQKSPICTFIILFIFNLKSSKWEKSRQYNEAS